MSGSEFIWERIADRWFVYSHMVASNAWESDCVCFDLCVLVCIHVSVLRLCVGGRCMCMTL